MQGFCFWVIYSVRFLAEETTNVIQNISQYLAFGYVLCFLFGKPENKELHIVQETTRHFFLKKFCNEVVDVFVCPTDFSVHFIYRTLWKGRQLVLY